MATNTVETKIVFSGDNTNLKKSIEEVTKQAKVMKQEFNVSDAADRATAAIHERAAIQSELIRRGVIEDPKLAAQRNQRASARQSLALAGLSSTGLGGVGSGIGSGQAIGAALEAYGLKGAAGFAGIAGGLLAAGGTALDSTIAYRKATQNEHMSQSNRDRQYALSIPGGKYALEAADAIFGTDYEIGRERASVRAEEKAQQFGIIEGHVNTGKMRAVGYQEQIRNAAYGLAAVRGNRLPGINTFDRSSAAGEREDREARIRLQGQTQLVMAERELAKASGEYAANRGKAAKLTEVEVAIRKEFDFHVGQTKAGSEDSIKESSQKAQALYEDLKKVNQAREQTDAEAINLRIKIGESSKGKAQALIAQRQNEIDILAQRESTASSTATRLGGMGAGGRLSGLTALEALKQIGIENAPAELISQAASVAPLEVQKMSESAGNNLGDGYSDRLRQLAPEDARDLGNLGGIRNQLDQKRIEQQAAQQTADEGVAETALAAKQALYDLLDFLKNDIPLAINDLAARIRLGANQP